jgi:hypothetical protein
LRRETGERHHQSQRYQSPSFFLRGSDGLSATRGLCRPAPQTTFIKPIDVTPY